MKSLFQLGKITSACAVLCGVLAVASWLGAVPPLSIEGLMDEKLPDAPAAPESHLLANQSCYVCHENMKTDDLVLAHTKDRIGCIRCHGESVDHRNDEDNITPPDKMFSPGKVDAMCFECHPQHNVPARKIVQRLQERGLASQTSDELICTSCHYQHRLPRRLVRWDKDTGKLLMREKKESGQ